MAFERDRALGRIRALALPIVAFGLLGACAAEPDDARTVDEVVLSPVFRLGALDGDAALSEVLGVTAGPDGHLYVTQWQVPHVSVFGPAGELVRTIGRGGSGPGEFVRPATLGWIGDTLWVQDQGDGLELFDAAGRFVRGVRFRTSWPGTRWSYAPTHLLEGGRIAAQLRVGSGAITSGEVRELPILRVEESGDVVDTIAMVGSPPDLVELRIGDGGLFGPVPDFSGPTHVFSTDGSYLALLREDRGQGLLTVTWVGSGGDTLNAVSAPTEDRPFSDDARARVLDHFESLDIPSVTGPALRSAAAEQLPWPDHQPAFTQALAGVDGRVWIRREETGDSARWELWAPDGSVAQTWAPADLEPKYADAGQLWGVRKNSMDVSFLYRYTVRSR